ncbi:hypothetical protein Tco_0665343 [Tanacetum coccineum]
MLHWCTKCQSGPSLTIPWFKLQIRVMDGTGIATDIPKFQFGCGCDGGSLIAMVGRATEVASLLNQGNGPDVSSSCNLYDRRYLHVLELKQLVTSGVGLSPILGNLGSRITGSAENIGGRSSIERSMSFEECQNKRLHGWYGAIQRQLQRPRFKIPASVLMRIARILANSAKALCKVRGEIDVEFRDEANAADPYKVAVLAFSAFKIVLDGDRDNIPVLLGQVYLEFNRRKYSNSFEMYKLRRNHGMDEYDLVHWRHCGKPAFRWLGVNGHPNTKSLALDTSNSKRRAFGTDITNYTYTKRCQMDSSSDWSSKGVTVAMHRNIDCVKLEHDENITMLQQP